MREGMKICSFSLVVVSAILLNAIFTVEGPALPSVTAWQSVLLVLIASAIFYLVRYSSIGVKSISLDALQQEVNAEVDSSHSINRVLEANQKKSFSNNEKKSDNKNSLNENESALFSCGLSRSLIDISPDAIIVIDDDMKVVNFNISAERMFGFSFDEITNSSILDTLVSPENHQQLNHFLQYCKNKNDFSLHPIDLSLLTKNGERVPAVTRLAASIDAHKIQYIFHIQDKSMQLEAEDKLQHAKYNDELTGLPNRHMAVQHIHQGIGDAKLNSRNLIVMKLGLDRFKHINDSLGHSVGDRLLIEISQRLKSVARRGDMVSRISGDQFSVTLVDVDKETNFDGLILKYVDAFRQSFNLDDNILHVSVSVGVACYPNDAEEVDGLMRNAESAMFQAKKKGGTEFCYYSREMRERSKERLYIENELRRAKDRNELDVFYQPQVDLKTGKIIGVEALVRWFHPKLGMISPVKFIPIAEEIGLISDIGQWVLKRACLDMAFIRETQEQDISLSVNLSANQFMDNDLVARIANTLSETGFPPESLELEITESLFMGDVDNVADILNILSSQGIRISMDDFGTGYSSLSYLKKFPINTIKVDRSFVKDITSDKDDASIVKATIQMAHSLSLDIVAEGVETEEQLAFLLSQKCDKIQGYYFSRPLSHKALVNLIEENRQIELGSDNICLISGYR